jgi:outer membrane protein TolC
VNAYVLRFAISLCSISMFAATSAAQLPTAVRTTGEDSNRAFPLPQPATPTLGDFQGSVPEEKLTPGVLPLTMKDALDRGLKYNLGIILGGQGERSAAAARLRTLSDLLPKVSARTAESIQQINLAAFGFPVPAGSPSVIGPFGVFDARANLSAPLLDLRAINNQRAANANVDAAKLSYADARETVTLVVADLYLEAIAAQSRVEAAEAQLRTAEAVFKQATDLRSAGVAAGIDVLRAQVQMGTYRQRLLAVQNALDKQKLALARAIGLAAGQQFSLADKMPQPKPVFQPLEQALQDAYQNRADFKRAQSLLRSAELSRTAAGAGYLPTAKFEGDYGIIGRRPSDSHGTFTAAFSLNIPIFQGGKTRAEVQQAGVLLDQRKSELADLRGRIDAEVRTAYLDVQSAAKQIEIARNTQALASQQLVQARDRFAAGVSGSLEVTQAEEAVVAANELVIDSLYGFNVAAATLARSVGVAERRVREFLGEQ